MPVVVICRGCGKQFGAPDSLVGKRVKCPQCAGLLTVESSSTPKGTGRAPTPATRDAAPAKSDASPAKPQATARGSTAQPKSSASQPRASQAGQPPKAQPQARGPAPTRTKRRVTGQQPGPQPAARDPLDLGDLAQLESDQDPLGLGQGAAPASMGRPQQPARPTAGGWQQQQHKPSNVGAFPWLIVLGIGGGGLALLLVVAIVIVAVVAFSGGDSPDVANQGIGSSASGIDQPTGEFGGSRPQASGSPSQSNFNEPQAPNPVGPGGSFGEPASGDGQPTDGGNGGAGGFGEPIDDDPGSNGGSAAPVSTPADSSERPSMIVAASNWHRSSSELQGRFKVDDQDLVIYHYSWLTRLLPELGYQKLYDSFDFDQTFIKGGNAKLCRAVIPEFLNPMNPKERFKGRYFEEMGLTHFVGMSGYAPTRNSLAAELPRSDPNAGIFGYDEIAKPAEITDGLGNTIMVLGTGMMAGPWVAGGGNTIKHAGEPFFDTVTGFGSEGLDRRGVIVMLADGSVRYIYDDVDPELFKALCTIHGGETVDLSAAGEAKDDWNKIPRVRTGGQKD